MCFFMNRKSQHGYGAITNDNISSSDPNMVGTTSGPNTTTSSSPTGTTGMASVPSRKLVKKPSVVYCMHGNLNGEDCCDNGGTTLNIKRMDSK